MPIQLGAKPAVTTRSRGRVHDYTVLYRDLIPAVKDMTIAGGGTDAVNGGWVDPHDAELTTAETDALHFSNEHDCQSFASYVTNGRKTKVLELLKDGSGYFEMVAERGTESAGDCDREESTKYYDCPSEVHQRHDVYGRELNDGWLWMRFITTDSEDYSEEAHRKALGPIADEVLGEEE